MSTALELYYRGETTRKEIIGPIGKLAATAILEKVLNMTMDEPDFTAKYYMRRSLSEQSEAGPPSLSQASPEGQIFDSTKKQQTQ